MALLWTIIRKELLHGLLTFRFAAAVLMMALLWGFSLWTFAHDFRERVARSAQNQQVQEQERKQLLHAWMARGVGMNYAVPPRPLSLFARGLEEEMAGSWRFAGETSEMPYRGVTRVGAGPFYENPARTLFPVPDPQSIIRLVGSLLALMLTYDALTREREQGTLALCGVQPVPRDLLLLGKIAGAWGLLVLASLVAGAGALAGVLPVAGVAFTVGEWLRLLALAALGGLYLLAFCGIGLALSAWCRGTGVALLCALAAWVLLVLVGPGLARVVGEQAQPRESPAQLEARKAALAAQEHKRVREEPPIHFNVTADNAQNRQEEARRMSQRQDEAREHAEVELARALARLDQDYLPGLEQQEGLVRSLARWSPAADFLHLAQGLAGTGATDAQRFRQALRGHQGRMEAYWQEKSRKWGWEGPVDTWEDAPRLMLPAWRWGQWLADGVPDLALLVGWAVGAFGAAFWGFRRMPLIPG